MAQGGRRRQERLRIGMHRGCLDRHRAVTIRIVPRANTMLSPVHIRAGAARSCT